MALILLYFRTVRFLKFRQVIGRLLFRIHRPTVELECSVKVRELSNKASAFAQRRPSLLGPNEFFFLNKMGSLSELGWNKGELTADSIEPSKLWRYNQHYFDDLISINSDRRSDWHEELIDRWVIENPLAGGIGWDPYPTSLRIVNWIKWSLHGGVLSDPALRSLLYQTRWLSKRVEFHILGNHLFSNGKALVFAGVYFSGDEAELLLYKGLQIIESQIEEQILQDGGHFERSTMYHSIFLEDLLDLINLTESYPKVFSRVSVLKWRDIAALMLVWCNGMIHPDGEIAFFNDAAFGICPSSAELNKYAARLKIKRDEPTKGCLQHFSTSGYIRLVSDNAVAFLDVAPLGPDYLPAHGHADTLSFELSIFGQRVVCNGGTSEYGSGEIRQMERGTSSHNTVSVNGVNSSEVWGTFRVARRAYPVDLVIDETSDFISVNCSHDGYCRLPGKPIHEREWIWGESVLWVNDCVVGSATHAVARFHLHPDVHVKKAGATSWWLGLPSCDSVLVCVKRGLGRWEESYYAPEFGKRIPRKCLAVDLTDQRSQVRFEWGNDH